MTCEDKMLIGVITYILLKLLFELIQRLIK